MAQLFSVLLLGVMIYAIVDAIITDSSRIQHMPKVAWVLLIVFLPLIGSILWFVLGKERQFAGGALGSFGDPRRSRPVSAPASRPSTESDLEAIDREIEFYEKQAEIRRLEAKLQARRQIDPNA